MRKDVKRKKIIKKEKKIMRKELGLNKRK